jgi:hypothetical protein
MKSAQQTAIFVVACMGIAIGFAAWAQPDDRDICVDACQQAKAQCVSVCGTHENPMECEEGCHEAQQECVDHCR